MGKWYTDDNIEGLLMGRHPVKKARRTNEDDRYFAESFERMITQTEEEFK